MQCYIFQEPEINTWCRSKSLLSLRKDLQNYDSVNSITHHYRIHPYNKTVKQKGTHFKMCLFTTQPVLCSQLKVKLKFRPKTGHEGPEVEYWYTSTLSLTSALDGRFTPGKGTRYPLYKRLGRPQDRSGWVWKVSPPSGFDPRTVQHVKA